MEGGQDQFVVHRAASQVDYDFITHLCKKEEWAFVGGDVSHVGTVPQPGFFIGILNGQRVGHVGVFKYGDERGSDGFYYVGLYLMDKEYRGKGYGLKIWNVMWESLDKSCNISLDSVIDMVPRYEKMGLREVWMNKEYVLSSSKVVQALSGVQEMMSSMKFTMLAMNEVNFDKLFQYDTSVFGFPRREFLEKWITIPNSLGWAAMNEDGDILGYVVMRPSVMDEKQQIIAPLFSDDTTITKMLLYRAAEAASKEKLTDKLRMWSPVGVNPDAAEVIENEIGIESGWSTIRMFSKGIPPQIGLKKITAITSSVFE